jgi:hypothetical protein
MSISEQTGVILLFCEHGEGNHVVCFIRQTQLHPQSATFEGRSPRTTEQQYLRRAMGIVLNLNILPADPATYTGTKRLGYGLLGGEALCQQPGGLFTTMIFLLFRLCQDTPHESVAEARQHFVDTIHPEYISAH